MLALEVAVLQQVLHDLAVLLAPLGLEGEVRHAEGVDGQPVAIDEDAAVRCDGVAVGVEEAVGVIEGASVGGVGEAFLGDEDVLGVEESEGGGADVALESESGGGDGEGEDALGGVIGAGLDLDGEAGIGEGGCVEGGGFGGQTAEHQHRWGGRCGGEGGEILDGEGGALGGDGHIGADVTAAEDETAIGVVAG